MTTYNSSYVVVIFNHHTQEKVNTTMFASNVRAREDDGTTVNFFDNGSVFSQDYGFGEGYTITPAQEISQLFNDPVQQIMLSAMSTRRITKDAVRVLNYAREYQGLIRHERETHSIVAYLPYVTSFHNPTPHRTDAGEWVDGYQWIVIDMHVSNKNFFDKLVTGTLPTEDILPYFRSVSCLRMSEVITLLVDPFWMAYGSAINDLVAYTYRRAVAFHSNMCDGLR